MKADHKHEMLWLSGKHLQVAGDWHQLASSSVSEAGSIPNSPSCHPSSMLQCPQVRLSILQGGREGGSVRHHSEHKLLPFSLHVLCRGCVPDLPSCMVSFALMFTGLTVPWAAAAGDALAAS